MIPYSIWLVPPDPVFSRFSQLIDELATEHVSPRFVPHVTLLGAINEDVREVLGNVDILAREIAPYAVSLRSTAYSNEFFKSLYMRAELTPAVQNAYDKATEIFRISQPARYDPHLSLMYGNLPEQLKSGIVQRIGSRFDDSFIADGLHVYETNLAEVSSWRKIAEAGLNNH